MTGLGDRLAKLSPEQRTRLALEISRSRGQETRGGAAPDTSARPLPEWESFRCVPGTPGNFAGLRFQAMERTAPGPGQIQIEAKAVSLNFRDLMIAMDRYPPSPGVPSVMGSDYAGTVLSCGEGVIGLKPGDPVMALSAGHFTPDGRIVEGSHFCATPNVSAFQAVPMPANLTFEEAAGVPTVFLTSYYALHHVARLAEGERLLVHSATGGVGMAAIQVARWLGAELFATAGSESKRALLESLGIAAPMDSRSTRFAEETLQRTGGEGVDVILNTLPGEAAVKGLEILRLFGRFLQIDKQDVARNLPLELGLFKKGLTFSVIDLSLFLMQPERLQRLFQEIAEHLRQGHFSPVRTTEFPIERLGEALGLLSRSQHVGKLVLTFP